MATKVFNMEGGLHSAAAYSAFENAMYGSVKANAADFTVSAGTGMNARISPGDGLIDTGLGFARRIQSDAQETVSIEPASTSYNRVDSVVAYIDTAVTPSTSVVDNTNGVLKFASVAGTAASSPQAPNQAAIQSAIGAGNPYLVLANITVPTNATNITDATFDNLAPTPLLKNYPVGAIFITVNETNPQTLFGGKWARYAAGRTLVGFDSTQTEFNAVRKTGGAKTHTLTENEMPSHRHKGNNGMQAMNSLRWDGVGTSYWFVRSNPSGSTDQYITDYAGGGQPHNNLQPYITTFMWERTA